MAGSVSCAAATDTSVAMEGPRIDLNHCHPIASSTFTEGILGAANVAAADGWKAEGGTGKPGDKLVLSVSDAATPEQCSITYVSAFDANTPPTIETTLSGC